MKYLTTRPSVNVGIEDNEIITSKVNHVLGLQTFRFKASQIYPFYKIEN